MVTLGEEIRRDEMAPFSTGVKLANAHDGLEMLSQGKDSANLSDLNWFGTLLMYADLFYKPKPAERYERDKREITIVSPLLFRAMETRPHLAGFNRDWYKVLAENPRNLTKKEIKLAKHFAESIYHNIANEVHPNLDNLFYLKAA